MVFQKLLKYTRTVEIVAALSFKRMFTTVYHPKATIGFGSHGWSKMAARTTHTFRSNLEGQLLENKDNTMLFVKRIVQWHIYYLFGPNRRHDLVANLIMSSFLFLVAQQCRLSIIFLRAWMRACIKRFHYALCTTRIGSSYQRWVIRVSYFIYTKAIL